MSQKGLLMGWKMEKTKFKLSEFFMYLPFCYDLIFFFIYISKAEDINIKSLLANSSSIFLANIISFCTTTVYVY